GRRSPRRAHHAPGNRSRADRVDAGILSAGAESSLGITAWWRLVAARLLDGGVQALRHVGRQRRTGETPRQVNHDLVGFDIGGAGRALVEMLAEASKLLRGQLAGEEIQEQLDEFAAGHHAGTSSKCGARALRMSRRARCSRLLTAATLRPSRSAISWLDNP